MYVRAARFFVVLVYYVWPAVLLPAGFAAETFNGGPKAFTALCVASFCGAVLSVPNLVADQMRHFDRWVAWPLSFLIGVAVAGLHCLIIIGCLVFLGGRLV